MKKQLFTLVLVSSILSAAMLIAGTTLLGKFSPVLASSLNALVSGTQVHGTNMILSAEKVQSKPESDQASLPKVVSTPLLHPALWDGVPLTGGGSSVAYKASLTVSDLTANPSQYLHQLFSLNGMASLLSANKILINDGTGEIVVNVMNGLWDSVTLDGEVVTLTGWLKSYSSISGMGVAVCSITGAEGALFIDVCTEVRLAAEPQPTANQPIHRDDNPSPTGTSTSGPTQGATDTPPTQVPPTQVPPTNPPPPRPTESPDDHDNGIGNDDKEDKDDKDKDNDKDDDSASQSFLSPITDILAFDQLLQDSISLTTEISVQLTTAVEGFFSEPTATSGLVE